MRHFLHFVLSRRNLGVLIGVVALCLLIALFGDRLFLFGDRPLAGIWQRLECVALILAIWLAIELLLWWRQHRADIGVLTQLLGAGGPDGEAPVGAELAELRDDIRDLIAELRRNQPGRGRQFLVGLPWYLVLGPAGGGKASLIMRSGLNLPLEDRLSHALPPAQPAAARWRWWLSDEALFISGTGTLPQRGWQALLSHLRRLRPRRPLDGVIVVLPVDALLAGQLQDLAVTLRQRLRDAAHYFGARQQVYIVITQCDRLLGFAEFCDHLDPATLAQPFGVALPVHTAVPQGGLGMLPTRLQELVTAVAAQVPLHAADEPDPAARARIALLPEQLTSVAAAAQRFATALMLAGRVERPPLLRGVLLTGAGQPGDEPLEPIDAWDDRFAQPVGLSTAPPRAPRGHAGTYFLSGAFRHLILPEAGLAGGSLRGASRIALLNGAGYTACLLLLSLLAGWWSADFAGHEMSLQAMRRGAGIEQAMLHDSVPRHGLAAVLPALDEALRLSRIENPSGPPGWLIDVTPLTIETARQAAVENYHRALQQLLLPALLDRLHGQLLHAVTTGASQTQLRSLLTTYLMFGDPAHYRRSDVSTWIGDVVRADFALDPMRRVAAEGHVARLLDLMPLPVSLDQGLIENARAILRGVPDVNAIYDRLKTLALASPNAPPLDVENALGAAGAQLLMLRSQAGLPVVVPGLYTRNGFYLVYLTQAPALAAGFDAADWVLGGAGLAAQQNAAAMLQRLTALYVQDYVRQWQSVIGQIGLRALPDLPSLAGGLQTMASPESPLIQLIDLIKRQTDLTPPQAPPPGLLGQVAKAAPGVAGAAAGSLAQAAETLTAPVAVPTDPQDWPGNAIRIPFAPLQALLDTRAGQAPALQMQNTLAAAYGVVSGVASAQAPDAAAQQIAGQVLSAQSSDPLIPLRVQAATLPRPLDSIFRQLYANIWGTFLQLAANRIEASWARDVAPVCEQAIARRYPFVTSGDPAAGHDVTLQDFANFFGPNGTMDKFVSRNLAMFTLPGPDGRLTLVSQNGLSLDLGTTALDQINLARQIRSQFFGPDGNLLVRFSLSPSYLDPRALASTLQIDQARMVYRHEPPRATTIVWPPTGDAGASFALTAVNNDVYQIQYDGAWALFRLVQGASRSDGSLRSRLTVTFNLHDYQASYSLRADSVNNPLVDSSFMGFRCVPRL